MARRIWLGTVCSLLSVAAVVVLIVFYTSGNSVKPQIPETNLADVSVIFVENHLSLATTAEIFYSDATSERIDSDYIALFVNGSIVKNVGARIKNSIMFVPICAVSDMLGCKVDSDGKLQKVIISDGGKTLELTVGSQNAAVDANSAKMDTAFEIFDDQPYVPLSFVEEALEATTTYFDGEGEPAARYFLRMPQVMISRYPDGTNPTPEPEAVEKVRDQLIIAYEKRYGEYAPLDTKPQGLLPEETELLRYAITNLAVSAENDRFYIMPMTGCDFWFDKYTGSIFTFYNGISQIISRFDPTAPEALMFAG